MIDTPADRNQATHLGAHEGAANDDLGNPSSDTERLHSGLKLWADVGLKIGSAVDKSTQASQQLARSLQDNTPVEYAMVASGTYVSGTPLLLNLGTPDQGTYWEIHSVAVGGTNYTVTAAGSAGLYVTAYANVATLDTSVLADYASTLPNVAFYGTRQVLVNDQETLCLVINSGTAGQVYTANAQMSVFRTAASGGRTVTVD